MPLSKYGIQLYKHQKEVLKDKRAKFLIPHGCGTGKTITLCSLIRKKNITNELSLIVTIKSDKDKWESKVSEFDINADVMTKEEFKKATTKQVLKRGYDKKLKEIVEKKVSVVNPSGLKKYNYICADEVHFFTIHTSMMYKSLMAYLKLHDTKYLWIATGTPCDDNPWKLYGLFNILGYERNYKRFQRHFWDMVKMGPRVVPVLKKFIDGRPIQDEIARYINFLGKTVKIDDCIDMPPRVLMEEYFDLTPDQKRAIKKVDEKYYEEKALGVKEATLNRNSKLHQICGGTLRENIKDEFTGEKIDTIIHYFKTQKLNRLVELCEDNKKIFIVCKYTLEVEMIEEKLRNKFKERPILTFTGKNSAGRSEIAKSTDNMYECIVIANAACSAAYECNTIPLMVFYSYDFSLINYLQIIDRIRRINNPASRTYLSLICKNSIDEAVFECIINKKSFDAAIFNK